MSNTSRLTRLGRSGRRANKYEDLRGTNELRESAADVLGECNMDFETSASQIELTAAAVAGVIPDDVYTIDQAVNSLGFGRFQIKLSLVTGLCWMADSMEMMILSILPAALQCEWGISSWEQAFITTVVFLGMMVSATFWGFTSDRYGRKKALLLSAVILSYYGILSSFAPSYNWLLILRSLVGFGVGCVPQAVTLYAEFLPMTQRAKCVVLLESFWALGACFEVLLALFVMPTLGWRWLLGFSAIPIIIFTIISFWIPESVRYYAATGNSERALATLQRLAKDNGKIMPRGRLAMDELQEVTRGRVLDLLAPELCRTTLLLWFIWLVCAFCYYGLVLMTTELFRVENGCYGGEETEEETCRAGCKLLSTSDYANILWTTLAEFPGIFITIFIIEKFGRKTTMAAEFILFSFFVLLLLICTKSRAITVVILFCARGIVSGVFQAAYVYTPEVYPTVLRSVGVGTCSAVARIGAMGTPMVAQVLLKMSAGGTFGLYAGMGLLAAVATLLLPIETKGRELKDTLSRH